MLYEEAERRVFRLLLSEARADRKAKPATRDLMQSERRLEPREKDRIVLGECAQCREDVCADEDHYEVEGFLIHNDCIKKYRRWAE